MLALNKPFGLFLTAAATLRVVQVVAAPAPNDGITIMVRCPFSLMFSTLNHCFAF
jgi:hypothetical protein